MSQPLYDDAVKEKWRQQAAEKLSLPKDSTWSVINFTYRRRIFRLDRGGKWHELFRQIFAGVLLMGKNATPSDDNIAHYMNVQGNVGFESISMFDALFHVGPGLCMIDFSHGNLNHVSELMEAIDESKREFQKWRNGIMAKIAALQQPRQAA